LHRDTVKRYITSDGSFIHASLGRSFRSKLDFYKEDVLNLINKGLNSVEILKNTHGKGFEGSESLLRRFVAKAKKKNILTQNQEKEKVARKNLISLLYRDIDKIKSITKEQLAKVLVVYPELEIIYQIVQQFKEAVLSRDIPKFEKWIERGKKLNIPELNSFIAGLERDLEAVKNAVIYSYSNGLAEGSINKIKVIKRIMYGRCSFELLRKKVLLSNAFN
jgi:transposase